jgi:hypothetical protein
MPAVNAQSPSPQDTSLVNVLMSLADGLLKMDTSMQAFMLHTSKRFDHIESRLTSFEKEQQKQQVHSPHHLAAREAADTTNRRPSLDTTRVPSPLRTQNSPLRRDDRHSGTEGDLQEALSALTFKLTKFHQQRQHSIPSSTTQSHAPSYAETEDISSGATRSTAVESSDGWLASATAATSAEVAKSGLWTPTNCSSHDAPRHSPPPKAHSPALRMVEDALTFHPNRHINDHRMQPPPAPPRLAVPHRDDIASSASPVMISQPRTEVYVQRLPAGSHKSSDHYDISDDALLHVAIKPTPSKKVASGSTAGTPPHAHRSNHDVGGAPASRQEDPRTVERWLSTVSSSDDGFRNDTFLVSRSTQ